MRFALVRKTAVRVLVVAVIAATLGGCGEIHNTIAPTASTFDSLTVLMPTAPNANYVGIYEAQSRGYFRQAALDVHLVSPGSASTDTLRPLYYHHGQVAISDEPSVLLTRNTNKALVAIAAIRQAPLTTVVAAPPRPAPAGSGKGAQAKPGSSSKQPARTHRPRVRYRTVPDNSLLPASLRHRRGLPTYNGLTVVVREPTIVNNAQLARRFVQAVARGYAAVKADPKAALRTLIAVDPALGASRALQLRRIEQALGSFMPAGASHPWGWQHTAQWNAFGTWLFHRGLLTDPNAIINASTNELLAGQGV